MCNFDVTMNEENVTSEKKYIFSVHNTILPQNGVYIG